MTKLIVLILWVLTLTASLFVLATHVWQGESILCFVGAPLSGVIGPLGTWAITKRHRNRLASLGAVGDNNKYCHNLRFASACCVGGRTRMGY
jgi:hypothetical protein